MTARSKELVACRACLAVDGRLYAISGSGLEDTLAALTGISMSVSEGLPRHLCAFCVAKLSKCVAFRDSCQRSTKLLQTLLEKGPIKNNIKAIDRYSHKLTNNLTCTKVFQFAIKPLLIAVPLIKLEKNENLHVEMDYIENEHVDIEDSVKNDTNDVNKHAFELPIEKRKKPEIKTVKTENHDKQLKINDQIEISLVKKVKTDSDNDTSDDDMDTSEINLLNKNTTKFAIAPKSYEIPPPIDMKAFEKKYNVDYKFMNKEEQMKEIEDKKKNNALKYCCDMCGRGYTREYSFVNHLWIHDPRVGPFECDVCRQRFRRSHLLLRHRYCHRDRYTCRECGLVNRDSTSVKSHHKVHEGSSYACPYCQEEYVRKNSYYNHVRCTHPEHSEACEQCGETFLSASAVRQHKSLAHRPNEAAILKCKGCDVTFLSPAALQRHEKLSAGVPHAALWPCAACGEISGSEAALKTHAAERHSPEQLHCDKCNKTFSNAASFSLHETRKHRGERSAAAPFRRIVSGPRRRTPGTGRSGPCTPSTRPRDLFVCEICGLILKGQSLQHLENHRNTHFGIKPFSCPVCSKKFTTKTGQQSHMLVHTGERPYACEQCSLAFALKCNLSRHVKNVHKRVQVICELCGKCMAACSLPDHMRHVHGGVPPPKRERRKRSAKRSAASGAEAARDEVKRKRELVEVLRHRRMRERGGKRSAESGAEVESDESN